MTNRRTSHVFCLLFIFVTGNSVSSENQRSPPSPKYSSSLENLKFSKDLFWQSPALDNVTWPENHESPVVYCAATKESGVTRLTFRCDSCTPDQNIRLAHFTTDYSSILHFPIIKLEGLRVQTAQLWHTKQLQCVASFDESETRTQTISVPILVEYYGTPEITMINGQKSVLDKQGYSTMYWPRGGGDDNLVLLCSLDAYPPVTNFVWHANKKKTLAETSPILTVTDDLFNDILTCQRADGKGPKSAQITIREAKLPLRMNDNFQDIRDSFHQHVSVGQKLQLQCSVVGYPEPFVQWHFEDYKGKISPANCAPSSTSQGTKRISDTSDMATRVNETCHLNLNTFNQTGSYWCTGCILIAENYTICDHRDNVVPSPNLYLNVTGPPMRGSNAKIEKLFNPDRARIKESFCTNPPSTLSSVFFTCNSERYFMMDTKGGIHFEHIGQSPTEPFCFEASISFLDLNQISPSMYCTMHVENTFGSLDYSVPVGSYIANNGTGNPSSTVLDMTDDSSSVAAPICISLAICLLIVVGVFGYLRVKRQACFASRKRGSTSDAFSKSASPDANSHEEENLTSNEKVGQAETKDQTKQKVENGDSVVRKTDPKRSSPTAKDGYRFVSNEIVV